MNTPARKKNDVRGLILSQKDKIAESLPRGIDSDQFARIAIKTVASSDKLQAASQTSLIGSLLEAAQLGLRVDGYTGEAYLVPFWSGKNRCFEVQMIPGYKGLIKLARQSEEIGSIVHNVCRDLDTFDYTDAPPELFHKRCESPDTDDYYSNDARITHAYLWAKLKSGEIVINVWPVAQIKAHRDKFSKGYDWAENGDKSKGGGKKDSPWHTDFAVMARKTVVRDAINRGLLPVSSEVRHLAMREEMLEARRRQEPPRLTTVDALAEDIDRTKPVGFSDHIGSFPEDEPEGETDEATDTESQVSSEPEKTDENLPEGPDGPEVVDDPADFRQRAVARFGACRTIKGVEHKQAQIKELIETGDLVPCEGWESILSVAAEDRIAEIREANKAKRETEPAKDQQQSLVE